MSADPRTNDHRNHRVRAVLALAAILGGLGLASGFASVVVLLAGLGWWMTSGAPVAVVPIDDTELDHVLTEAPADEGGYTEPVREETPVRRAARAAPARELPVAAAPAAEEGLAVAEASAEEPAAPAAHAEPSTQDAIRAMRARMASGAVDVVDGEAGRVSVSDG